MSGNKVGRYRTLPGTLDPTDREWLAAQARLHLSARLSALNALPPGSSAPCPLTLRAAEGARRVLEEERSAPLCG